MGPEVLAVRAHAAKTGSPVVKVSARMEEEMAGLEDDERQEFLESYGVSSSGLDQVIRTGYGVLGLISYFTVGPKEVRAWTIEQGWKALQGRLRHPHGFRKGFIRAEVIGFADYAAYGTEAPAARRGCCARKARNTSCATEMLSTSFLTCEPYAQAGQAFPAWARAPFRRTLALGGRLLRSDGLRPGGRHRRAGPRRPGAQGQRRVQRAGRRRSSGAEVLSLFLRSAARRARMPQAAELPRRGARPRGAFAAGAGCLAPGPGLSPLCPVRRAAPCAGYVLWTSAARGRKGVSATAWPPKP